MNTDGSAEGETADGRAGVAVIWDGEVIEQKAVPAGLSSCSFAAETVAMQEALGGVVGAESGVEEVAV